MEYNKNTCPKDKFWFIDGGECGAAVECIFCDNIGIKNLAITIQKDYSQITSINIEDIEAGVFSIKQVTTSYDDEPDMEDEVHLTVDMLREINNVVVKIPFEKL